jgi:hypothetical protein
MTQLNGAVIEGAIAHVMPETEEQIWRETFEHCQTVLPLLAHSLAEQVESGTVSESLLTEINRTSEILVKSIENLNPRVTDEGNLPSG